MTPRLWYFTALPAWTALLALLELDAVSVGPLMVSRPIVLGPALGAALGRLWEGGAVGAALELLTLQDKPLGSCVPLSAPVATGAAVIYASGPHPVPVAAALPAGLAVAAGIAGIESMVRSGRRRLADLARERAASGRPQGWAGLIARSLGVQAAATAAFLYACFAAAPLIARVWESGPAAVRAAAGAGWEAAPWVGLAVAIFALAGRS